MLGPELVMTKISYGGNTIVLRGELNITERYLVSRLNLKARPVAFMFPDSSEVPFNEVHLLRFFLLFVDNKFIFFLNLNRDRIKAFWDKMWFYY